MSQGRPRWSRLLHAAWFLLAGYVLLLAPLTDVVWNESFWAEAPRLQAIVHAGWFRFGTSALGGILLIFGTAEVVMLLVADGDGETGGASR